MGDSVGCDFEMTVGNTEGDIMVGNCEDGKKTGDDSESDLVESGSVVTTVGCCDEANCGLVDDAIDSGVDDSTDCGVTATLLGNTVGDEKVGAYVGAINATVGCCDGKYCDGPSDGEDDPDGCIVKIG